MEQAILSILTVVICSICCLHCKTREPAVDGKWYSADSEELKSEIRHYLAEAKLTENQLSQEPAGLVVPHAGYIFSAPVAAYSYKYLEHYHFDTVIIIGSSHHYYKNKVSVYDGDNLETPLGNIAIDREITESLLNKDGDLTFLELIHTPEHSNESQFPFIRYLLPEAKVVSILTSTQNKQILHKTAEILYDAIHKSHKEVLLICSTDMSHFHSYNEAKAIDNETISLIESENWEELHNQIRTFRNCELCGYDAFEIFRAVVDKLGRGAPFLLHYANSGDAVPEYGLDSVVGYCAMNFPRKGKMDIHKKESGLPFEEKEWLLTLARNSIASRWDSGIELPNEVPNEDLKALRAVFVTLHKNGELRGCIGHMTARWELYRAVWEMAEAAAFDDPRFAALSEKELDEIEIEISVLTPMKRVHSIDEIEMCRDGVMVQQGYHSGVYLPQVAVETGWDKETFLRSLCSSKAMLPPESYLDPQTEIYIFQVEEFKEEKQ